MIYKVEQKKVLQKTSNLKSVNTIRTSRSMKTKLRAMTKTNFIENF